MTDQRRRINFSEVWDKIRPEVFHPGHIITTFRHYTPAKMSYYQSRVGTLFDVTICEERIGTAVLKRVDPPRMSSTVPLSEIKEDTHQSWTEKEWSELMQRFYGEPDVAVIRLVFIVQSVAVGDARWF